MAAISEHMELDFIQSWSFNTKSYDIRSSLFCLWGRYGKQSQYISQVKGPHAVRLQK